MTAGTFNVFRSYEIAMSYSSEKNYRPHPMSVGLTALIPEYLYSGRLNKRSRQLPRSPPPRARSTAGIRAYWTCTSATGPPRTSPNIYRLSTTCVPPRRTLICPHLNSKRSRSFNSATINFSCVF